MDSAVRRSAPLAAANLPSATGGLCVRLCEPKLRFIFRGAHHAAAAIGAEFGVALPLVPCRFAAEGTRQALWLGPDEWLLMLPDGDAAPIAAGLKRALGLQPHSLVDVSHRNAGLLLDGPGATDVLNAGCPLDLNPEAFPVGTCARTVFGKAEIVLWRTAPTVLQIETGRSFLPYVAALIAQASMSCSVDERANRRS